MDIISRIQELKKQKNAVILAHNYQLSQVQDIADYSGDSLGLSRQAAETNADIIVFCGVYFMAETAKILSPQKTVLIPDAKAGCPMADMIKPENVRKLKAQNPQAKIVCYVNTSAKVKAECDVCCTSTNAIEVVEALRADNKEVIFVPDKYLGQHVCDKTGYNMKYWNGYCPTHVKILAEGIKSIKKAHPQAKVMVHPECNAEVRGLADAIVSTGGMCTYAKQTEGKEIIVGTEIGMLHRLQKENPGKTFYPASKIAVCSNMKRTSLEKVLYSLEHMSVEVTVPEDIRIPAKKSIDAMLNPDYVLAHS